jgi:hypothetical protein
MAVLAWRHRRNRTFVLAMALFAALACLHPGLLCAREGDEQTQTVPPAPDPALSVKPKPAPMTGDEKFRFYLKGTFGVTNIFRSVASAGINQAQDHPTEWGQGMRGYGHRLGAKFAQHSIKRTIQFGVGAALEEDPRTYSSGRIGLWPRTVYAVTTTFVTPMDDGRSRPAIGRLTGAFAAGMISRSWYPERERDVSHGLRAGAISIAQDAGFRLLREFWPDIRRKLRH